MPKKNEKAHIVDTEIGKKIKNARTAAGLSMSKIAKSIGVTYQQFSKYENGSNGVSISRLYLICETLNLDISYFINNKIKEQNDEHSRLSLELNKAFIKLNNYILKRCIVNMVRNIKESENAIHF